MPDTLTTQITSLATVPNGTAFECYKETGGTVHFPVEFVSGGTAGNYTFQAAMADTVAHGLPVQIIDGADATLGAQADVAAVADTGTFSLMAAVKRLLARVTTFLAQLPAALTVSGNLKVSLQESNASQAVTGTFWQATQPVSGTFWQATQPVSLAALPALAAGTAVIGHVIVDSGTITTVSTVTTVTTVSAVTAIINALPAGTNLIGGTTPSAGTTGGASVSRTLSAASTNGTLVKGSAATLYSARVTNFSTTQAAYVKLYNSVSNPPVVGTDAVFDTIACPAAVSATQPSVVVYSGPAVGIAMGTGIGFGITAALADNDTTVVAASGVLLSIVYK